jgi:hypothetical protein
LCQILPLLDLHALQYAYCPKNDRVEYPFFVSFNVVMKLKPGQLVTYFSTFFLMIYMICSLHRHSGEENCFSKRYFITSSTYCKREQ